MEYTGIGMFAWRTQRYRWRRRRRWYRQVKWVARSVCDGSMSAATTEHVLHFHIHRRGHGTRRFRKLYLNGSYMRSMPMSVLGTFSELININDGDYANDERTNERTIEKSNIVSVLTIFFYFFSCLTKLPQPLLWTFCAVPQLIWLWMRRRAHAPQEGKSQLTIYLWQEILRERKKKIYQKIVSCQHHIPITTHTPHSVKVATTFVSPDLIIIIIREANDGNVFFSLSLFNLLFISSFTACCLHKWQPQRTMSVCPRNRRCQLVWLLFPFVTRMPNIEHLLVEISLFRYNDTKWKKKSRNSHAKFNARVRPAAIKFVFRNPHEIIVNYRRCANDFVAILFFFF